MTDTPGSLVLSTEEGSGVPTRLSSTTRTWNPESTSPRRRGRGPGGGARDRFLRGGYHPARLFPSGSRWEVVLGRRFWSVSMTPLRSGTYGVETPVPVSVSTEGPEVLPPRTRSRRVGESGTFERSSTRVLEREREYRVGGLVSPSPTSRELVSSSHDGGRFPR